MLRVDSHTTDYSVCAPDDIGGEDYGRPYCNPNVNPTAMLACTSILLSYFFSFHRAANGDGRREDSVLVIFKRVDYASSYSLAVLYIIRVTKDNSLTIL